MDLTEYIPLDKSWTIRIGILDLLHGYYDTIDFLEKRKDLGDDLKALLNASKQWKNNEEIDVGESGTLYRFLQFISWKLGLNKRFIKHGTLRDRKICDDPNIVDFSLKELLKLDNGTSQWASAAVLLGKTEKLSDIPFKLKLTYEALEHWNEKRKKGLRWEPRLDETIRKQAESFLDVINGKEIHFIPEQAEDYCFARAFGLMTKEEGLKQWPQLQGHESNRIIEMETELFNFANDRMLRTSDHRVIQAIAMLAKTQGKIARILHPDAANKSWPQFWKFLKDSDKLAKSV